MQAGGTRRSGRGAGRTSELSMQPKAQHRDRTTDAVVGGIVEKLIAHGDAPGGDGEAVVGLDDLLETRVRQPSVSDQDTETACVQKRLVASRDTVEDPGNTDGVVRTLPQPADELGPGRHRSID